MTATLERTSAGARHSGPRRRVRRWPHRMVPTVLVLLGVLVMLYPVGATYYNNYKQAEFARTAYAEVKPPEPGQTSPLVTAARAYNAALKPGLYKDPWATDVKKESGAAYQAYLGQLSQARTMARLRIPVIKVDQPVYHGTGEDALGRGVGHLFGTDLPVGGIGTHSVLTAHSGLANATHFDRLHELALGNVIYVDVAGETLAYEVDEINVVLPDNFDHLPRVAGQDLITLITCTPYAVNSHRLLVRAHRIPYNAAVDVRPPLLLSVDWSIQPWMRLRFGMAAAAVLMWLVMALGWIRSDARRRRRRKNRHPRRDEEVRT